MKNDALYGKLNGFEQSDLFLTALKRIEQKLETEVAVKRQFVEWQQEELKRLKAEIIEKNNTIGDLSKKLNDCRTESEGNRQLINKLITDIDRLQQAIEWYRRTYETRSLAGIIKDKLKHFFIK